MHTLTFPWSRGKYHGGHFPSPNCHAFLVLFFLMYMYVDLCANYYVFVLQSNQSRLKIRMTWWQLQNRRRDSWSLTTTASFVEKRSATTRTSKSTWRLTSSPKSTRSPSLQTLVPWDPGRPTLRPTAPAPHKCPLSPPPPPPLTAAPTAPFERILTRPRPSPPLN